MQGLFYMWKGFGSCQCPKNFWTESKKNKQKSKEEQACYNRTRFFFLFFNFGVEWKQKEVVPSLSQSLQDRMLWWLDVSTSWLASYKSCWTLFPLIPLLPHTLDKCFRIEFLWNQSKPENFIFKQALIFINLFPCIFLSYPN